MNENQTRFQYALEQASTHLAIQKNAVIVAHQALEQARRKLEETQRSTLADMRQFIQSGQTTGNRFKDSLFLVYGPDEKAVRNAIENSRRFVDIKGKEVLVCLEESDMLGANYQAFGTLSGETLVFRLEANKVYITLPFARSVMWLDDGHMPRTKLVEGPYIQGPGQKRGDPIKFLRLLAEDPDLVWSNFEGVGLRFGYPGDPLYEFDYVIKVFKGEIASP